MGIEVNYSGESQNHGQSSQWNRSEIITYYEFNKENLIMKYLKKRLTVGNYNTRWILMNSENESEELN